MENMLCICPNGHVLLDRNAILLNLDNIIVKHKIDNQYVDYHNSRLRQWGSA
jgi:predicted restriction endonuclease